MHVHIERQPPPIAEMAQRLAARVAVNGTRGNIETIGPHSACPGCRARRERSLKHCHLPAEPKPRHPSPRDTGAYVPEMAARIDNDRNLTDGAKICARKLMEYVYRKNREAREAEITVPYLMKAMDRCRRSVQGYLRELEREGYIEALVVPSPRTRMCFGLLIRLLDTLFPKHRRGRWPAKAGIRGAQKNSQIYSTRFKRRPMKRALWAFICCEGVWRSYMKTLPPLLPFPATNFPTSPAIN